jgi:hypothetical protein
MQANDLLQSYLVDKNTWDEMYQDSSVREQYKKALEFLQTLSIEALNKKEEFITVVKVLRKYFLLILYPVSLLLLNGIL